jgi:hypothetical protein
MATFMEALDTSIANVAMPHIGGTPWFCPSAAGSPTAWAASAFT